MTTKLSDEIISFLERSSTELFLNSAKQFVELVEIENIANEEFYIKAHTALINLYLAGHNLEQIDLKYSNTESYFGDVDNELFKTQNTRLSSLGQDSIYWEVFDPIYEKENELTQGWLVDDFADIYRDLKIELDKIYKIGTDEAIEDALWQLKWSFIHHWGNHCIDALRALHYLNYDGKKTM